MAVIGATELQPVNVVSNYLAGQETRRNALAQQQEMAMRQQQMAMQQRAAQREAELSDFMSTADISLPETQNQLLRFGKSGAELAASAADIAGKRATARKSEIETEGLRIKQADDNYGRFQKVLGDFAYGDTLPDKRQLLDQVEFMIAQGIIRPEFREFAVSTLADDPTQLQAQLRGQFLSQIPPADRAKLFLPTAGERLSADVTMRGQDIGAANARRTQDITIRGQDISAETTRRAQDITIRGQDLTRQFNSPEYKAAVTLAQERAKSDVKFVDDFSAAETTAQRTLSLLGTMLGDARIKDGRIVTTTDDGKAGKAPMKGFEAAVGAALFPGERFIPGTNARDFVATYDQAIGAAFLEAFKTLKGGGQITEKEGEKATAAMTRMNLAQGEIEFVKAAREFETEVRAVLNIAQNRYAKLNPSYKPGSSTAGAGAGAEPSISNWD
jgi:hypothetical protein